jgi:hypothetical protein
MYRTYFLYAFDHVYVMFIYIFVALVRFVICHL